MRWLSWNFISLPFVPFPVWENSTILGTTSSEVSDLLSWFQSEEKISTQALLFLLSSSSIYLFKGFIAVHIMPTALQWISKFREVGPRSTPLSGMFRFSLSSGQSARDADICAHQISAADFISKGRLVFVKDPLMTVLNGYGNFSRIWEKGVMTLSWSAASFDIDRFWSASTSHRK